MFIRFLLGSLALLTAAATGYGAASNAAPAAKNSNPAAASPANSLFADPVVARSKTGLQIKRSQLDEEVIRIKAQLASQNQPVPRDREKLLEQGVLEQMISLHLLTSRATKADQEAGKALAEKRLDEAKKRLGSEESMLMRLRAENLTLDQLLNKWTQAATAETVVRREVKVNVTDDQVKKFYNDNPGKFEQPEMVRVSHILFSTRDAQQKELTNEQKAAKRKQAEEVLKRARAGEDFAKLVKEFSEDPASKEKGGEYTFPRGRMVPEFEAASFSMNTNQVSDIVTTQFGYHIIKLYEKIPARKLELAKVADDLKEALVQEEIKKQLPDYLKKLKQDASVEILDETLKPREVTSTEQNQ